jgi:hypothetical protein
MRMRLCLQLGYQDVSTVYTKGDISKNIKLHPKYEKAQTEET